MKNHIIDPQKPSPISNQIPEMISNFFAFLGLDFNRVNPRINITIGIIQASAINKNRNSSPCPLNSSIIIFNGFMKNENYYNDPQRPIPISNPIPEMIRSFFALLGLVFNRVNPTINTTIETKKNTADNNTNT